MKTHAGKILVTAIFTIVFAGIITWINAGSIYLYAIENDFIKSLKEELDHFSREVPEDRVYLQFDKPFYQPGESIWFSAYVRNGIDMKPSKKSDIIHVELISPQGNVEKHVKLVGKNGQVNGDFQLDPEAAGGIYKIKAYTNWQKNENNPSYFEKEIQVQEYILPTLKMDLDFERKAFGRGDQVLAKIQVNTNENRALANYKFKYVASLGGEKFSEKIAETDENGTGYINVQLPADLKINDGLLNVIIDYQGSSESISRSIPIVLNKINFTMFPEGGDLVEGIASKVAFKALNEFNKPADVEGIVVDSKGKELMNFSSMHMGMGAFAIKPLAGEKYSVRITKPKGINQTFELPEILSKGYVLNAYPSDKPEISLLVQSTEKEELSLVVQIRSKIYYSTALTTLSGGNHIVIPTEGMPMGVAQITLFDSKGIERAERLLFVNKDKKLKVSISTDKEKYLPREKVRMTLSVKDDRGLPMPAHFSLAVTNDQLLSFADDKSGNIISKLLLEQDIKDKVEEPAFYFGDDSKANEALDYLMMTSGWRRFKWEQVTDKTLPHVKFSGEKAIVSGTVYDGASGKIISKAKVSVNNMSVFTNEKGQYSIKNLDPEFPVLLQISAEGYNTGNQYVYDYSQNVSLHLYKPDYYTRHYAYPSTAARAGVVEKGVNAEGFQFRGEDKKVEYKDQKVRNKVRVMPKAEEPLKNIKKMDIALKDKEIFGDAKGFWANGNANEVVLMQGESYVRAREFPSPVYENQEKTEERTDFRTTIFWNGNIELDRTGKKIIEFYNSDDISSFRAIAEGLSVDGMIGRSEMNYYTQLPFSLSSKIPTEVITGDIVSIPVTLKNNTNKPLGGFLDIKAAEGFQSLTPISTAQTIMPGSSKTIFLDYKIGNRATAGEFKIAFKSCGLDDAFSQKLRVLPKGFPVTASFSGQDLEKEFNVELLHVVDSSIKFSLTAYPSVINDLMSGIEGILQEPGGCFEQTSMSSYPNAMVLDYLQTTDTKDDKTLSRATALLDKGYKRLTTFETKDRGYEWFGSTPGHEALTAYGLMQFADMKRVGGDVDIKMMDRTSDWLMSRKDGKGGFLRNNRALDNFGRGSEEITNAYITYALAEAGNKGIVNELDYSFSKAVSANDPYMLALMANAMYKYGDFNRGDKLTEKLYALQESNGGWKGKTQSITYSTGESLTIETTSLAIMAILKQRSPDNASLTKAVKYLVESRSGYGTFGNTQGTVLALKALTEFAKASKRTASEGTIEMFIDGKKVAEKYYSAGQKGNIEIVGLEKFIDGGKHKLKVKFKGTKDPLPFSISLSWNTTLPNSSDFCAISVQTKLASKNLNVGETARLSVNLRNVKDELIPSPIAIIGIPGGFTVQPWQLKELQEKNVFDYYEVKGSNVILYYRSMNPSEIKNINFDLKAEVPGEYSSPASSAYLYYTNEYKNWVALDKVIIKKQAAN